MLLAAAAVVSLPLAACGSSAKTGDGESVQVKLTDAGCDPAKLRVPAGRTTFEVTNDGADDVSEFEVLDGGRVLGEVENLTPGLSGSLSVTLEAGTYTTECPGGKTAPEGELVVGG